METGSNWTFSDFVTEGRFSDELAIRKVLVEIVTAAESQTAVLLFAQAGEVFRSLFLVEPRCSFEDELRSITIRDSERVQITQWMGATLDQVECSSQPLSGLISDLPPKLRTLLNEAFPSSPVASVVTRSNRSETSPHSNQKRQDREDDWILSVILLSPGASSLNRGAARIQNTVKTLAAVLHCHEAVFIQRRRNRRRVAAKSLAHLLSAHGSRNAKPDSILALRELCAHLATESRSDGCEYFRRAQDHLVRVASYPDTALKNSSTPESTRIGENSAASIACRRRQTILQNASDQRHDKTSTGNEVSETSCILAVPALIHRRSAADSDDLFDCVGVFRLWKSKKSPTTPYTYWDVRKVEAASQTYFNNWSQRHNTDLSRVAAQVVRDLHLRSPLQQPQENIVQVHDALPADFALATHAATQLLTSLYESIDSIDVVTVRVLSVDRKQLALLASWPSEYDLAFANVWTANRTSPLWKSIHTHRRAYFRAVELPYLQVTDVMEVLSIPLHADASLVGVAYFGTRRARLPASAEAAATTTASAIEDVLQAARGKVLAHTVSMASAFFEGIHDVAKLPQQIVSVAEQLQDTSNSLPEIQELKNVAGQLNDALAKCWGATRASLPSEPPDSGTSVEDLAATIVGQWDQRKLFRVAHKPSPSHKIDASVFRIGLAASYDILSNAWRQVTTRRESGCTLETRVEKIGPQTYCDVIFSNNLKERVPPAVVPQLFRVPVRHVQSSRMHLGAFLAACLVRSIGGDIYIECLTDSRIGICIRLPVELDHA